MTGSSADGRSPLSGVCVAVVAGVGTVRGGVSGGVDFALAAVAVLAAVGPLAVVGPLAEVAVVAAAATAAGAVTGAVAGIGATSNSCASSPRRYSTGVTHSSVPRPMPRMPIRPLRTASSIPRPCASAV